MVSIFSFVIYVCFRALDFKLNFVSLPKVFKGNRAPLGAKYDVSAEEAAASSRTEGFEIFTSPKQKAETKIESCPD
jgi:hypothetical protein